MENKKETPEELTEIVRAIEVEQESLDYKIMEDEVGEINNGDDERNYGDIFEAEESLDYSNLFSYLGNSVKENPYVGYESVEDKVGEEVGVGEKCEMDYKEVQDYVKMSKIANLFNQDIKFSMNYKTREKFETFKLFNNGFVEMIYDLV